jgi:hypothetical protein
MRRPHQREDGSSRHTHFERRHEGRRHDAKSKYHVCAATEDFAVRRTPCATGPQRGSKDFWFSGSD